MPFDRAERVSLESNSLAPVDNDVQAEGTACRGWFPFLVCPPTPLTSVKSRKLTSASDHLELA